MNKNPETEKTTSSKHKPVVAIIGRPNVGKSTLFNRIISSRKAIVEDTPGVTRDRIYEEVEWKSFNFSVIDTGGIVPYPDNTHHELVREQVDIAVKESSLILFVLDAKTGLMPHDTEILEYLRKCKKPLILVVNKVDHSKHDTEALEFHSLGMDNVINVSSLHNRNIYELMDMIINNIPRHSQAADDKYENAIHLTVTGKPNVGKSTLVNKILGENRFITSPVPGTTRDSIDTRFTYKGREYVIIDTAGIRRKSKVSDQVERFSVLRAIRAIERSDIVLFMVDGPGGPTHQDARLSQLIHERGKASIILLNKWDLAPDELIEADEVRQILSEKLRAIDYSPVITVSALTGLRLNTIFKKIESVYQNYCRKIPTKKLNNFLTGIKKVRSLPSIDKKELKFYYMTQISSGPPVFVIFTNAKKEIPDNYRKFVENQLRTSFDLEGAPVKLIFRTRSEK